MKLPQIYSEESSSASADLETAKNLTVSSEHSVWSMDGTFKIVPKSVLRKVTDLGMRTKYIHEAAKKKKIKMLMAAIRTNSHLEGWQCRMRKRHIGFYELLELLTDEQNPKQQQCYKVASGRIAKHNLQIRNYKYNEVRQHITALTAEYNGGTRTMEQFLKVVAYDFPETVSF
ncbi:hypothetical protein T11_3333 [Trichinella zimbabwensis]|uniref:Uncharacterized protein n=1 Tax=Trichinella zimbabwensis TaxID=268475 RepID=A0A0V1I8L5_9BILA|nr:hypothetical protein T11_3333 [Trichinella zimbabwensis]